MLRTGPRLPSARAICTAVLLLILGVLLLTAPFGHAAPHVVALPEPQMAAMPDTKPLDGNRNCDDMASSMTSMSVMGQSMAAMTHHMCITPVRPLQPGDEEKIKDLINKIKTAIEKYKNYKKALADGYAIGSEP